MHYYQRSDNRFRVQGINMISIYLFSGIIATILACIPSIPYKNSDKLNLNYKMIYCIENACKLYNLNPELVKAIIKHESNYKTDEISPCGAVGLMQVMPSTGRLMGYSKEDLFNPCRNIMAGCKYLRKMLNKYNQNIILAIAAYNCGPGNIDKGIVPNETIRYVQAVIRTYKKYCS